jgi:DEAD/DEAH box helicase domain-containing protein
MTITKVQMQEIVQQVGLQVIDEAALPSRTARYLPVPSELHRKVRDMVVSRWPKGLYAHQSNAIETALRSGDISLATSTASGKSLVFMAIAADILFRDPLARVLALYPARALIEDQHAKWLEFVEPFGFDVGRIDGSVAMANRENIVRTSRVLLMTPDVAHAWLMSNLQKSSIHSFMVNLKLLVLDEAHVYDGVFGTNMAYFLRRLEASAGRYQLITSSATLGEPAEFIQHLTGRRPIAFGAEDDGAPTPTKSILLLRQPEVGGKSFERTVNLLKLLAGGINGSFLAFGDSRKMVEQLVAAALRGSDGSEIESGEYDKEDEVLVHLNPSRSSTRLKILPYRAGYEASDRSLIQQALAKGQLKGVVSTSALELGLDIGEIDLAVLLTFPPSVKGFWQRLGRMGRRNEGVCLLMDNRGILPKAGGFLKQYLARPLEPSWLYLDNRYIQYAHALCAAMELGSNPVSAQLGPFTSLPPHFQEALGNELNPIESVPQDLYQLKQRAEGGPHREFPLRSAGEKSFEIRESLGHADLGDLTFAQTLREAYPGSIYYYMALPYRVKQFKYRDGEILVQRTRGWTTQPIAQTMVFPRFGAGVLNLWRSDTGFLAEAEIQVSERVLGFTERRGGAEPLKHLYDLGSPYAQRPLNRFFPTSGVCWFFSDLSTLSEELGNVILEAFCVEFGVQERDLGVGHFYSKDSPLGHGSCQGLSVFDAVHGSLRLTQRLAENFVRVLDTATSIAQSRNKQAAVKELQLLRTEASGLRTAAVTQDNISTTSETDDLVDVIAPGAKAMYLSNLDNQEVTVLSYRYTPKGLVYDLMHHKPGIKWTVPADLVQPIFGQTQFMRVNLVTGEQTLLT